MLSLFLFLILRYLNMSLDGVIANSVQYPNYASVSNIISVPNAVTTGTTATIQEDGYIRLHVLNDSSSSKQIDLTLSVNGTNIYNVYLQSGLNYPRDSSPLYPVKAGDIVKLVIEYNGATTVSVGFYPFR